MSMIDLKLPSKDFFVKTTIAILVIFLIVNFIPDTWGVKKWFKVN